jgi:hypothetical protein
LLKNYTYKQKLTALLIGGLIFAFIAYFASIKKSILLFKQNKELFKKIELVETAPQNIKVLETELNKLDALIGKDNDTTAGENTRQLLLEKTANYCQENMVVFKEFSQPFIVIRDKYLIETNTLILNGSFCNLLKFVYLLEKSYQSEKVTSVRFNSYKDFITKETILTATIYVQKIKKK